jgi:hypothetical protein
MTRRFANTPMPGSMTTWEDLPLPVGPVPYHLKLSDVIDATPYLSKMVVHFAGDTGGPVNDAPQRAVAWLMESTPAAFLYILGDVVYFTGQKEQYYPQFYQPYGSYPGPIFSIPGNHDGATVANEKSLEAWMNNFCRAPTSAKEALESQRTTMDQPNCYWTLETPLATIIGLYTNVPEGGVVKPDQAQWLVNELFTAPRDKALVLAMHHPLYSCDGAHNGSAAMQALYDNATLMAGRYPDLVLAGHVHNYQRFMRRQPTCPQPVTQFVVAGAGGYPNLDRLRPEALQRPIMSLPGGVTLEAHADDQHGLLVLTFTPNTIDGQYITVDREVADTFSIQWRG